MSGVHPILPGAAGAVIRHCGSTSPSFLGIEAMWIALLLMAKPPAEGCGVREPGGLGQGFEDAAGEDGADAARSFDAGWRRPIAIFMRMILNITSVPLTDIA
jgi:hypothetical protein